MLPIQAKKTLIKSIPSTVTLDGHTFNLQKSFGQAALNSITAPTVNLSIISEGKRIYRSMDDCMKITGTSVTGSDIRSAILQYTVGASKAQISTSDIIKRTSATSYTLPKTPAVNISSIPGYTKDVDYKLLDDHETLQWLTTGPAVNTNFTVNYDWVEDGYWIAFGIADYLMQESLANLIKVLATYDVNVTKVGDIVDLSEIYVNSAFNVCTFDIHLTYPYTWARTVTEEDGSLVEAIDVDLFVNDKFAETIHVP